MQKIKASVFIITKNEEKNITRCLNSVKNFDEIIIVDSGSTDKTLKIAKEFNCKILHQDWLGFAKQKQFALEKCNHEWVLNLDADEEISIEAVSEIFNIIKNNTDLSAVEFKMANYFCNHKPSRFSKHMAKIRFAKKIKCKYDITRSVHESMNIDGKIQKSKNIIYHYGENDITKLVDKINQYSSLRTINKRSNFIIIPSIFAFLFGFFKSYVIQGNIFNGKSGFIGSFIIGFYCFLKKAKLYHK